MNHYVYIHKTEDGEIFYVGMGQGRRAYTKSKRNKFWQLIVETHGLEVFIIESGLSREEASNREKFWIAFYGRRDKHSGTLVNLTSGGAGTVALTDEVRERLAEYARNRKFSENTRQRMKQSHTGTRKSKSIRDKISRSGRGKIKSEETIQKLQAASQKDKQIKKTYSERFGRKMIRCIDTGKCYSSLKDASTDLGIPFQNISKVCHGKRPSAGGFTFEFVS
jgi:hypothetical protein